MNSKDFKVIEIRELSKEIRMSALLCREVKKPTLVPHFLVEVEFWPDQKSATVSYLVFVSARLENSMEVLLSMSIGIVFQISKSSKGATFTTVPYSVPSFESLTAEAISITRGFVASATAGHEISQFPLPAFDATKLTLDWISKQPNM
jgi:hypothetical protein